MLHLVDILRLQKVDRETFNFSMPYFYFSASPGIAFVIVKVLYLYYYLEATHSAANNNTN